jgi:hypothetical protein
MSPQENTEKSATIGNIIAILNVTVLCHRVATAGSRFPFDPDPNGGKGNETTRKKKQILSQLLINSTQLKLITINYAVGGQ